MSTTIGSRPVLLLRRAGALAVASGLVAGCGTLASVQSVTGGVALGSGGSNRSMVFIAPTGAGPIVIDLGWRGAQEELVRGLAARGWSTSDVAAVLMTHAHRDHISAWPVVSEAPFYLASDEVPLFTGKEPPPGPVDGFAHRLAPAHRPEAGELELRPFGSDTALAFGGDTVLAFLVPGHTRGSAAYLFRDVLFVGDAAGSGLFAGVAPPTAAYSLDTRAGAANLARLLERTAPLGVRYVCTAHARCVDFESARERFREHRIQVQDSVESF